MKLEISDNGIGISEADKNDFGMNGLNERIKLYKGNLNIDSVYGKGTKLAISFPVSAITKK
ncbi:MAG: hypothetical protein ABI840_08350 [bacterium]